jgi:hypothetical protein
MENEGTGLTRTRLTVRKRVRRERRIVVTKSGGLLVDPEDLDETKGTKVPADKVVAAVVAQPGISYAELGDVLGVSKDTATAYVKAMPARLRAVPGTAGGGPGARVRVYAIAEPPNNAEQARFGDPSAIGAATEGEPSPVAVSPSIDRRSASAIPLPARAPIDRPADTTSDDGQRLGALGPIPSEGPGGGWVDMPIEEDYPRSAWDLSFDDPDADGSATHPVELGPGGEL